MFSKYLVMLTVNLFAVIIGGLIIIASPISDLIKIILSYLILGIGLALDIFFQHYQQTAPEAPAEENSMDAFIPNNRRRPRNGNAAHPIEAQAWGVQG
ncbi:hypothetical protein X777_11962 [Ooceraea biroi]|uniref:Uncharacterized protein n=1 Tax=Ooceraea biroi TaxID=2015173 RepID=A0A026W2I5_OOCBI|nr:hypothetical protein X777_11962 [Ooceraea biroi]